ncbi:hypothetical protein ACFU98_44090 [Streptomyces sp. NPDC057575]|uniref:hypothetical protein n=1 Tax=unclassified Streptomyces TaxID=2593676 RepID=UPI00367CFE89
MYEASSERGDVAPKVVAGWRARVAVESPSHLRTHPVALRVTLLAALLHEREREITDTLVELLISTVHRIGARAENTLMLQDILGEPEWAGLLTPADRRGLTPLFWSHVLPYGEVNLDMGARLDLSAALVPGPRTPLDTRQPTGDRTLASRQ